MAWLRTTIARATLVATVTTACAGGGTGRRTVLSVPSPDHDAVAFVTESQNRDAPDRELWVGLAGARPQRIELRRGASQAVSRIVWSSKGRAVVFVVNAGRGPDSGVVIWRSATRGARTTTDHLELPAAASLARISVDDYGRVTVPATDLRPDFPLWLPAAASGDVGFYSDGSCDLPLQFAGEASPESVTESLRMHFLKLGWLEQPHEILNPALPTSFTSGWRVLNGGVIPEGYSRSGAPTVRGWAGEWRRSDELLRYSLMHVEGRLTGYASYAPPNITHLQEKVGQRQARASRTRW